VVRDTSGDSPETRWLLAHSPPVVTRDVFLVIHRAMSRLRRIRAVCTFVEQAVAAA
jgi:hypothetical protein